RPLEQSFGRLADLLSLRLASGLGGSLGALGGLAMDHAAESRGDRERPGLRLLPDGSGVGEPAARGAPSQLAAEVARQAVCIRHVLGFARAAVLAHLHPSARGALLGVLAYGCERPPDRRPEVARALRRQAG